MRVDDGMGNKEMMIRSFLSIVHFKMGIPKRGSTLQRLQRYQLSIIASSGVRRWKKLHVELPVEYET